MKTATLLFIVFLPTALFQQSIRRYVLIGANFAPINELLQQQIDHNSFSFNLETKTLTWKICRECSVAFELNFPNVIFTDPSCVSDVCSDASETLDAHLHLFFSGTDYLLQSGGSELLTVKKGSRRVILAKKYF